MKQIQIDKDLFMMLCRYHLMDIPDDAETIKTKLQDKLSRAAAHDTYTKKLKDGEQ